MYIIPKIFQQFPELIAVESTRKGGVSKAPYSSLNLGLFTKDKPENVKENRKRFFETVGIRASRVAHSYQVHKDKILKVTRCRAYEGYDSLITENTNSFMAITVADCIPVLIYDTNNQAVAAVHAGWKGTVADITAKTIQRMEIEFKTNPKDCYVYVGTCIDES
jgi:polyphenol oxidase